VGREREREREGENERRGITQEEARESEMG